MIVHEADYFYIDMFVKALILPTQELWSLLDQGRSIALYSHS